MKTNKATIVNRLGLHARAAALLVKSANTFRSSVSLEHNGIQANAKNIMEVLMLAATKGSVVTVSAAGSDEDEALAAVLGLIQNKFHETE